MTYGDRVVERFRGYAPSGYTFMETWGTNRGPVINRWSALWGWPNGGQPWCGIGMSGVVREVPGAWDLYGGSGFLSPSVAVTAAAGRSRGWAWRGGASIPAGSVVTYGSAHTNMVVIDHGPLGGLFTTVGANESNGIKVSERSTFGASIWVPPKVTSEPTPPRPVPVPAYDYGLEDVRARGKQFVITRHSTSESRDKRLAKLTEPGNPYRQYHPRPHRISEGGRPVYLIIGGPVRFYGPYDTKQMRADAKRILAPRVRRIHGLAPTDIALREYRIDEPQYREAREALAEWLARYG